MTFDLTSDEASLPISHCKPLQMHQCGYSDYFQNAYQKVTSEATSVKILCEAQRNIVSKSHGNTWPLFQNQLKVQRPKLTPRWDNMCNCTQWSLCSYYREIHQNNTETNNFLNFNQNTTNYTKRLFLDKVAARKDWSWVCNLWKSQLDDNKGPSIPETEKYYVNHAEVICHEQCH